MDFGNIGSWVDPNQSPLNPLNAIRNVKGLLGYQDAPPPPDYTGAAAATAASNLANAKAATVANRVNQTNDYGTSKYTQNPDGSWSLNNSLNPEQKGLLDQSTATHTTASKSAGNLAGGLLGNTDSAYNGIANMPINAGQTGYDAQMKLLQPQIDRENAQSDAQLAAQGITPGSEAYNNAKQVLNQSHNSLMASVANNGVNLDLSANAQGNQNANNKINTANNTYSTLNNGTTPVNMNSTLTNAPLQTTTAGTDYSTAANNTYNADLANTNANNAFTNGLLNAGATIAGSYLAKPSDIRIKKNISKLFSRPDGLNVYSYDYKDGFDLPKERQIGLMAHEVEIKYPDAVVMLNGYKAVKYARV